MQAEDVALMRVMLMANMGFPLAEEHKKIIDALPVGWKLHPSHPMKEVTEKMAWACDGCSAKGYEQVKHFRCCMGCNFDLCNKCYTGVENDKVEASPLPELIRPGPPEVTGLPFRDEYDETKTTFWDDFRKPYVGQILFSSKPIERFVQDPSDLKTRFEDGGEIHACAVWPRALRNYPIAHAPGKADVPVYGPKFILKDGVGNMNLHGLQLFVYVSVDGKPVGRDFKWNEEVISGPLLMRTELGPNPPGSSSSGAKNDEAFRKYAQNFSPDTVDYWAMNQTKTFGLFMKRYYLSDNWEQGIALFIKTLAQLSPGEHKVEVDFRFRLVVNEETCAVWKSLELLPASECFPEKGPTQISHPIARGEFTYVVTPESAAAAAVTANPLPERSTQLDPTEADRLEQLLFEVMKESPEWGKRTTKVERVLKVVIAGAGWRQLQKEHPKDEVRYTLDFNACVYRSPLDGWPEESLTTFGLGAVSYSKTPTNRNDIIRISVGGNRELDADLVPESAFAEVGVRRCPAAMRRGVAK